MTLTAFLGSGGSDPTAGWLVGLEQGKRGWAPGSTPHPSGHLAE